MMTSIEQLILQIQTDRTTKPTQPARSRTRWTPNEEHLFEQVLLQVHS